MEEMKIVYLPVGELIPYEKNAKQHPDEQVEHIANSIREFGFRQPLVVDENNVVVIGHGRLMAAKRLGLEQVPVIRADDLTEAQIKALRLADEFKMAEFGFTDGNELPPIPENLDAETDYDEESPLSIKLTFANYTSYSMHEHELKEIAERMGCEYAVVKA